MKSKNVALLLGFDHMVWGMGFIPGLLMRVDSIASRRGHIQDIAREEWRTNLVDKKVGQFMQSTLSDPLLASGVGQLEMCKTITTGVVEGVAQLGVWDTHEKMLDTIANITVEPPDLSPIMTAIAKLNINDKNAEMLEAISRHTVAPIDLRPMEKMMQEVRNEVRRCVEETQREFITCREELRQEVGVLRLEAAEGRKEARSDAEVLAGELRALPQVLTDMRQAIRKLEQKADQTEVLQAVQRLKPEVDVQAVAEAVHERLAKASLKVENVELLEMFQDHQTFSSAIIERQDEVLQHLAQLPDLSAQAISSTVQERLSEAQLQVDTTELINAIGRLDHRFDSLTEAINSADVDLQPIHDAISQIKLIVDHTPVLEAIGGIERLDAEAFASAVHTRMHADTFHIDNAAILRAIKSTAVDLSPVLEAIANIDVTIDNSPVLEAIRRIPQVDLAPLYNAIIRCSQVLDLAPVLDAINSICIPDQDVIADTVNKRLHLHDLPLDFGPIFEALERTSAENTSLLHAIQKLGSPHAYQEIANAVL